VGKKGRIGKQELRKRKTLTVERGGCRRVRDARRWKTVFSLGMGMVCNKRGLWRDRIPRNRRKEGSKGGEKKRKAKVGTGDPQSSSQMRTKGLDSGRIVVNLVFDL
jgi:hypothetical protein